MSLKPEFFSAQRLVRILYARHFSYFKKKFFSIPTQNACAVAKEILRRNLDKKEIGKTFLSCLKEICKVWKGVRMGFRKKITFSLKSKQYKRTSITILIISGIMEVLIFFGSILGIIVALLALWKLTGKRLQWRKTG